MTPPATAATDRLLHSSPDRSLFVTTAADGQPAVCKVWWRGAAADAEREAALARLAAAAAPDGAVGCLGTGVEPHSRRPCLWLPHHDGTDLQRLVAARGALPAAEACRRLAPVAATLARLHALRDPQAPHGLVHGDLKPANLLATAATTLLLDFEHARAVGSGTATGTFTGGSYAFAPPEAAAGAAPSPAFDVFGLGRTLAWLLTGGSGRGLPLAPACRAWLDTCTAADPAARPTAAAAAAQLRQLAADLDGAPAEVARQALASGDLDAAAAALPQVAAAERPALARALARAQRLRRRLPRLLQPPAAVPAEPEPLRRELRTVQRVLRHFPAEPRALRYRQALVAAVGRLLGDAAAQLQRLLRAEDFALAEAWLGGLAALLAAVRALPGGCPLPADDPRGQSLLAREPERVLRQLQDQLQAARGELDAELAELDAAEQRLDLAAAEQAIERMAGRHGGSSPTAARRRDRLHRLGFYLARCGRAATNLQRLGQLWDPVALQPVGAFLAAAGGAGGEPPAASIGLRSLQVTLANLLDEFPQLAGTAGAAHEALAAALHSATEQAWAALGEAQRHLGAVPVPVRPLQTALGRLDTFRQLEAFVDLAGRPRSQLLDGIEALRLAIEQARATRDRLAHSAEQALARGHWTTGLFDMERAVAGLPSDDLEQAEAQRLQERLAAARRQKQAIESAVRRQVELAARYAAMQDDPSTSFADRLRVLAERRDTLQFLCLQLPAERSALYGGDRREVDTQIALEQAALAESELDATREPEARLQRAQRALEQLGTGFAALGGADEAPARLLRALEHWRTLVGQCQREVDRLREEAQLRRRQRLRLFLAAAVALVASAVALGFALRSV